MPVCDEDIAKIIPVGELKYHQSIVRERGTDRTAASILVILSD